MIGRGPGRGRGRGPAPVRAARVAHARQQPRAAPAEAPAPAAEAPSPAAPAPSPPSDTVGVVCGFPRCEALPEYGFADEKVAKLCVEHKSDDMVLLVADPDNPKEASLALAREYKELEAKFEALMDAPGKAHACERDVKMVSEGINKEESEIKQLTAAIENMNVDLQKEQDKPKGITKIGGGRLGIKQNPEKIEKLKKDIEMNVEKVGKIKGQKELDEARLKTLKEELPGVQKPYKEYKEVAAKMNTLKADAIDNEASALYLACRAQGKEKEMHAEGDVIFLRLLDKA